MTVKVLESNCVNGHFIHSAPYLTLYKEYVQSLAQGLIMTIENVSYVVGHFFLKERTLTDSIFDRSFRMCSYRYK